MGKTETKKREARDQRLKEMPRRERMATSAKIKKSEGRVLNSAEKRAIKMKGTQGALLRAWEILRASADKVDEKLQFMKQQAQAADAKDGGTIVTKADFEEATGNRHSAVDKVLKLLKDEGFETKAHTPVGSRIIQSCIKFGTHDQREQIFKLLQVQLLAHCCDQFGHFALEALIRHATQGLFTMVITAILPFVAKLAPHKCGVKVLHAVYSSKLSNAKERNLLVLGIFKDSVAVMKSWPGYPVLEDMLAVETDYRKRLLTVLFDLTDKLVSQKDVVNLPFVQRLLCVLFQRGRKAELEELSVTLKPHLVTLSEEKEGAELASRAFSVMPPKVRKETLRGVADNFVNIATGKHSAPFVARLFDLAYDPQIAVKFLATPLAENVQAVVSSMYGARIFLHLVTPDAERKKNLLLPNWKAHNLYDRASTTWNTFTWMDAEFNEETVEICPKPAEKSHQNVMGIVIRAFVDKCCKPVKDMKDGAMRAVMAMVSRIAVEVLHLHRTEPAYAAAMALTEEDVEKLESVQAKKAARAEAETEKAAAEEQKPVKAARKSGKAAPEAASADEPATKKQRVEPEAAASPSARKGKKVVTVETPRKSAIVEEPMSSAKKGRKSTGSAAAESPKAEDAASPGRMSVLSSASAFIDVDKFKTPRSTIACSGRPSLVEDEDAPVESSARLSAAPAASPKAAKTTPAKKASRMSFGDDDASPASPQGRKSGRKSAKN